MTGSTSFKTVLSYLPEKMRKFISDIPEEMLYSLMEFRIRAGGPVYFVFPDKTKYLLKGGGLAEKYTDDSYKVGTAAIREIIDRLSHFSVHSCKKQFSEGCFVIENGIRVGISGIYSTSDDPLLYEYSSLNFRIPRCINGCADRIFNETLYKNVIICGGVNSGKTTVLRELCRLNGNIRKASLIDERNEIACVFNGVPTNDVGTMTDILTNTNRSAGIMSAVRTLSPEVVFCDEISSLKDSKAILNGIGCGVNFVVTAHGSTMAELYKRSEITYLIENNAIDYIVFLCGASFPSKVREIKRIGNVNTNISSDIDNTLRSILWSRSLGEAEKKSGFMS
ncbi:MAG: hypothetical protein J6U00_05330 [Ruminococcus sp.]|uniref:hypothetical protein n=1 Tax=Ruminococcus sp. TaxID=41978 RepID=UPI001B2746AA|nr:hypothetical protein [Ruminococcus sp.]MBO7473412.1 hypothetical protein [Ruminococcus sp.]